MTKQNRSIAKIDTNCNRELSVVVSPRLFVLLSMQCKFCSCLMSFNPNPVPGYGIGTGPFLSYLHIYVPLEWSSEKKTMQEEVLYTTAFIRNGTYGISQ